MQQFIVLFQQILVQMQGDDVFVGRREQFKELVEFFLAIEIGVSVHEVVVDFGDQLIRDVDVLHCCVRIVEHLVKTGALATQVLEQNRHITKDSSCNDRTQQKNESGKESLPLCHWSHFRTKKQSDGVVQLG